MAHCGMPPVAGDLSGLDEITGEAVLPVQSAVGTSGRVPSAGECRSEQLSTFNFTVSL